MLSIITSAMEVMFSSAFSLLAGYAKTTQLILTKFGGKVAHGPRIWLDFDGDPHLQSNRNIQIAGCHLEGPQHKPEN